MSPTVETRHPERLYPSVAKSLSAHRRPGSLWTYGAAHKEPSISTQCLHIMSTSWLLEEDIRPAAQRSGDPKLIGMQYW
jgi:hypothetical protein